MLENKALPHNTEIEGGVLGSIINNNNLLMDCIDLLSEEDFYATSSKIIYKKIKELFLQEVQFDVVTFLEKLTQEERNIIGIANLTEMTGNFLSQNLFSEYIRNIKEFSNRRKVIKESDILMKNAYDTSIDFNMAFNGFLTACNSFESTSPSKTIADSSNALESTVRLIEERYTNPNKLNGISTGIKNIDKAILGLSSGDLIILAGRPSMGKTVMALNIASNINANDKVLIFSLEMVKEKLFGRILAAKTKINSRDIMSGNLKESDFLRIATVSNMIARKNNIFVDDRANLTVEEIKRTAKKQKLESGLRVLIVDHVGKVAPSFKGNRNEIVGHITNELKNLAKELGITVIALCQLNRSVETRNDNVAKNRRDYRPALSDLRDSGNIEQDADIVAFVYRDDYYSGQDMKLEDLLLKDTIQLYVAKGRDVGISKVTMNYDENFQLITERY